MTHSETEEGSEDEEEEEEDEICEEEEEEEDSEDEGDVGNGVDRVDLAVQTSLGESPSQSPGQSGMRFRGQRFTSTPSNFTPSSSGNDLARDGGIFNGGRFGSTSCSPTSTTYSIMSPHLRKNLNKFGSLNEALSTLPQKTGVNGLSSSHSSSHDTTPPNSTPPPSPVSQATPRNSSTSFRAVEERTCNSMIISTLIIVTALLFFLFIGYQYHNLKPDVSSSHRVPVCKGALTDQPGLNCVPQDQMNSTVKMFSVVAKLLQTHGLNQLCVKGSSNISLPLDQVLNHMSESEEPKLVGTELKEIFQNFLLLVRENPGWHISLTSPTPEEPFSHMMHTDIPVSWRCWFRLKVSWMVGVAKSLLGVMAWALGGFAVVWLVVWLWRKWVERAEKQNKEVFELVEQVLNILYHHHQGVLREGKSGSPFYPILHIRDQLIAPPERTKKATVWKKVEEYMRNKESRVREDIQKVYGEEYKVWQWLPDIPWSPSSSPSNLPPRNSLPSPGGVSPSHSQQQQQQISQQQQQLQQPPSVQSQWGQPPATAVTPGWQGSAFQLGKHVAAPVAPPTSCLKVRHLFDVQKQGPGWVVTVKEEILRRCLDAQVLHIAVDTESPEGTVYIKTMSPEDAGKVFRCLHGQWYRGQLVTAKYLRLERYHERFPDSRNARAPLKSNK